MSKTNVVSLTKEEIEEEIINNELMSGGGVENPELLQQINLEEQKSILRGIEQSEGELHNEATSRTTNQSTIDTSHSNFPSLPGINTKNMLKLPRKPLSAPKILESSENSDLLDSSEAVITKFNLPFCADDGALPLTLPDMPVRRIKNPYYVMNGENPAAALKRMLAHHDAWHALYTVETGKIDQHDLGEDIEESDSKEHSDSPKNNQFEEKENDPYTFVSDSPKVYSGPRKRDTNLDADNVVQLGGRQLQRKASRESDCEEVEPILKPEEPKRNECKTTARPRSKRNRKQLLNQDKGQVSEVEFDFDNKWDSRTSTWCGSPSSLNNQSQNRRHPRNTPVVEEKKVQCPICQRNFAISKVEAHASACEGYSGSPMDVEEES